MMIVYLTVPDYRLDLRYSDGEKKNGLTAIAKGHCLCQRTCKCGADEVYLMLPERR